MLRKNSLTILCIILSILSCDKKDADPTPSVSKLFSISSITPAQVVDGDSITIVMANIGNRTLRSINVGDVGVEAFSIEQDSILKVVVPGFTTGGAKKVQVKFSNDVASANVNYLPFEFKGVADPNIIVRSPGASDTFLIKANNLPKHTSVLQIWEEQYNSQGTMILKQNNTDQRLKIIKVIAGKGIVVQAVSDPGQFAPSVTFKFLLRYREQEFPLSTLSFRGAFRIDKWSYNNVPENEIILYQGARRFSTLDATGFRSQVYLNGIKLKQNYHDPIPMTKDGYSSIESFAVPADLAPGEYPLTVFQLDGTTPILSDSTYSKIKVSALTYCADKASYNKGTDIKINIYPYVYPYRCYSCPKTVNFKDAAGEVYSSTVKSIGASDASSAYLVVPQPASLPASGVFSFEMKSPNGAIYTVKEGCATPVITIN